MAASSRFTAKTAKSFVLMASIMFYILASYNSLLSFGQSPSRRPQGNRNRISSPQSVLKDTFYEDNSFVVRVRTTYNQSNSITCNGIVMEDHLILSDITCIKYQNMANIDARFVEVIAGEPNREISYEVEQIYLNKADSKDPGTELALLKLAKPLKVDTQCRNLIRPEKNHSIESETAVRVIGYTNNHELKENRTKVAKRGQSSKYICTMPADINETPGSQLLKGAPLLQMVDCRQYQLVGIFTKMEIVTEPGTSSKKHQDCFIMVSTQIKWYEQVRSLATLAAKNDGTSTQPSVITVTVDDE